MEKNNFLLVSLLDNTKVLFLSDQVKSVATSLDLLPYEQVENPVLIAAGYIKNEGKIVTVYNLNQNDPLSIPSDNSEFKKQQKIILILKHKLGVFGILIKTVRAIRNTEKHYIFNVPDAIKRNQMPYDQYAVINTELYPVISATKSIEYFECINRNSIKSLSQSSL